MPATSASVRARMAAASKRIGRLKRIDRAAVVIITLGGISVVVAVLGILVFIAGETLPLFRGASFTHAATVRVQTGMGAPGADQLRAVGVDEYQKYLFTVEPEGVVAFHRMTTGERAQAIAVPHVDGARVTASSRSVLGQAVAAGLSDGRVVMMHVRFAPVYEGAVLKDVSMEVRDRGVAALDPAKRPIRQVSNLEQEGQKFVAGLVADDEVICWWTDGEGVEHRATLRTEAPHRITQVRIGRNGAVIAGTDRGTVYHWDVGTDVRVTDVTPVSTTPITALEWMLGGNSWVAATEDGGVSAWFRAPTAADTGVAMARAHVFEPQSSPVVAVLTSGRDRSFATVGRDGTVVLRHQTSERILASIPAGRRVGAGLITPKADALLTLDAGVLDRYTLSNPHPETSWKTLFGKVWYEGYAGPAYVWQSTAATDDFEAKLSLVPLVFGTIKGTLYAMLFAVPLALLGALYTSQFMDPALKARIKPTVEIMAALPSVVIGFLAGLYLAAVVERHLVGTVLMLLLLPAFGTSGVFVWRLAPKRWTSRFRAGTEVLIVIVPLLALAGVAGILAGPTVEDWLFSGDARLWLQSALGLTYDQRNCLVVGLAMGFAIIPLIFTISEDAFSSVPTSLTAASLALGASPWQTAWRIVLPTASPGVFSAIMIGFGRAVGETMIVLMATGNTPVMDWSIFNGIRTLSANIAVEVPEAPYGGTLYRTLFLAATLLFIMTFLVNTVAEVIRQRLRERYRAA